MPPLAAPRAASAPAKYLIVEAQVELVLLERLLDRPADLVEQELVAEAVLPGLDRENAGAR